MFMQLHSRLMTPVQLEDYQALIPEAVLEVTTVRDVLQ